MATCGTDLEASDSTSIEDTAGQVRNTLSCATPWTKATDNDVRSVFTEAYGFFRLLRSQRSTYQVRMLPILQGGECLTFDSEVMEETITSQHCVSGQPVGVSAFPGLYKLDEEMNECVSSSLRLCVVDFIAHYFVDYCVSEGEGSTKTHIR